MLNTFADENIYQDFLRGSFVYLVSTEFFNSINQANSASIMSISLKQYTFPELRPHIEQHMIFFILLSGIKILPYQNYS